MRIVRVVLFSLMFYVVLAAYGFPQDTSKLSREEVLEGENIGLKQGQLIERREGIIKTIKPQLDQIEALDKAIQNYANQIGDVEKKILEARTLDASKFKINWKESKIEEKPMETAKK